MPQHLKIAIVGAGPASLTLANILQKNDIPFTMFEASSELRTQGGSLDLHPASGQLAIKEAGLWDVFTQHARPESDVMKIVNMDGEVLWDENGTDKQKIKEEDKFGGRPEIDRMELAKLMYENLEEGKVQFGRKLKEAVPSEAEMGKYDLHFANQTKETGFDLIVGGDGAWSKVRKLVSDQMPEYSGISSVTLTCNDIKANSWLLNYVGEGSMMAFGKDCAVQSQRQGDGSVRTYASLRVPEDFFRTCGIDWSETDTARKEYIERYISHIHEDLQRVLTSSTDEFTPRAFYELPVGFRWSFRSGVTLIGDAAHVFTPFAGEGVNVGMKDALVLAQEIAKICNGEKSLDQGIKEYEEEMFPRSTSAAVKTAKGKDGHFSETGAKEFADRLKAHYYGNKEK
ncbi:UbiH 2-polyprenyl-6-methoxyphenol hydroxylase [Pyrenophora tritici-repentis]|uniref:Aromatic-ring hydroxylase n=2 Tax=Pyrenophora tritici-repentis TaxID=45151 RepID=A0A2W1EEM7_9PLEO|nr:monooxygenase [Pyrenophora tritici-repentis Pt-1C-BFP]KAA8616914.1 Aromatic-ring hydroxylase-like [Pyrenophora tritici-repentis]EDU50682.1 monoxygenase [Pyrenophora tritici-repentis Pt-1C-BFP]KAF7446206.1 Aromatic-ring hydroxylase [Pyrenophora tritici-repentis]KAF7567310.1 UbiH, 2-polyprenyl-6-methoxyphenol hydroxylase and related FAD-dependent oxidoreductase [Pyrenophora tritici-repentis]KAG9381906.1 Aromatic-ring hydroxylase [Pyrenophora tritici-repentis]